MLQLTSNREPPLASTIPDEYFPIIWGGCWFLQLFEPLYLKLFKDIEKQCNISRRKI